MYVHDGFNVYISRDHDGNSWVCGHVSDIVELQTDGSIGSTVT